MIDRGRHGLGPVRATYEALDPAGQESLAADLTKIAMEFNRAIDGTVVMPAEYLEIVAMRAG
jgi:hypothetical protein